MLLSRRDGAATWVASMDATVLDRMRHVRDSPDPDDPMTELFGVMLRDVVTDLDDPASAAAGYERRLVEVRAEIAPERLVEWEPGDGWEPLCRALDVPVPDVAFPHENSRADFRDRTETREAEQQRLSAAPRPPAPDA